MRYVRLTPRDELIAWVVGSCGAITAFMFSHTFYVTVSTFWCGVPLVGATAFLFWVRFRYRVTPLEKIPRRIADSILVLLSLLVVLYVLGVATYYE
jgi:hypothetical protein